MVSLMLLETVTYLLTGDQSICRICRSNFHRSQIGNNYESDL